MLLTSSGKQDGFNFQKRRKAGEKKQTINTAPVNEPVSQISQTANVETIPRAKQSTVTTTSAEVPPSVQATASPKKQVVVKRTNPENERLREQLLQLQNQIAEYALHSEFS